MKKKNYQSPEAEIEKFSNSSVITTSGPNFDGSGDSGDTEF